LDAGCAADTKFFDTKKLAVEVADPLGEAEVKTACCTPFADAKCSDWSLTLGACPAGKDFEGTNSAPADGSDGKTLSQSKYEELCCVDTPQTCTDFSLAWVALQVFGGGCAADTKFFDTKKLAVEVAATSTPTAGEAEVKAACCTAFADAKCSDWAVTMGVCPVGKAFEGTNSAPADGTDGKTLSESKYHEMCCVDVPQTCSDFSVAWVTAQVLGAGCAADTKFFDTKKHAVEVAATSTPTAGEAAVKAACCTPFADAKCSDWAATLQSCTTGTFIVNTNSAPAEGSDGTALTQAKFQQLCCESPMKCEDYNSYVSSSVSRSPSLAVAFSGIIAMVAA
jgi:hypothetical protein